MRTFLNLLVIIGLFIPSAFGQSSQVNHTPKVQTANGTLQGRNDSGVHVFKGIPFAQSPVGELRWKAPQPVKNWTGVRKADHFAPRCMQRHIFSDMNFRSDSISEDCLYLNVWTPTKTYNENLPVLVYFYGGGFVAGDASEYRYDGESMARNKGIVAITVNYRLGVFGFLSHPELTQESQHHASGDYGLLDQAQALHWVKENVAAFGGDPAKITIAGESAGSISVSALMASPLCKSLFRGVIGESGSILGALSAVPLSKGERTGVKFATTVGAHSLADLRKISADSLLKLTAQQNAPRFPITVDGYFFPKSPDQIYKHGEQAQVPLLVGWNSEESNYRAILGNEKPTPENYAEAVHRLYKDNADEILKYYPGSSRQEVIRSGTALASDRFIAFSTWKWSYMQSKTGEKPVYRYYYSHPRPAPKNTKENTSLPSGAVHSSEIEYAMGNLPTNLVYSWTPDDYQVSDIMQDYFANFIKTADPNGLGVPEWKPLNEGSTPRFMHIDVDTRLEAVQHRDRHLFLDSLRK